MTVEVSDPSFQLLPEYSGAKSGRLEDESGLDCPTTWPTGDLGELGEKTIRLKVNFRGGDAAPSRLYAVYLRSE
jgi:hypothetical protein